MAYQLAILPHLSVVNNVFRVLLLKAYHIDNSHIVSFREIELQPDLTHLKDVVKIVGHGVKILRRKKVPLV